MIGQSIGNHKIIKLIGEGGMGTVFLAEHERLGRKVAIKMLHPHLVRDPGIRARFKNEATLLARLQHRNIVTLYDYVEEDDALFLIMEYVEGRDLDDLVRNEYGPFPTHLLKTVFEQVLDALGYAHSQKVIHRDIKPSNFILTNEGVIKVLDFGIAKIFGDSDHNLTKTGTRMGTVFYMSPEQVRGEKPDERSDIYSLGMMLFNLATGQLPFHSANSEFEIYNQIVSQELPTPSSVYPGVPASIERLIQVATQKDKMRRFQSCDDFRKGRAPGEDLPRIPANQNAPRVNTPAAAAHPRDAKTVVDMRSIPVPQQVAAPVANSRPPVQRNEVPVDSKAIGQYDQIGLPLNILLTIAFFISVIVAAASDDRDTSAFGVVVAVLTAGGLPLMIGSFGIRSRQSWGWILNKVFSILQTILVSFILLGFIIAIAGSKSILVERVVPSMLLAGLSLFYSIWTLKAVFSKGSANYFKKS
jgi:serine/threonine protein kinase